MPHLSMSVCSAGLHKRVVTGFGRQGASGRHPCPSLKLFDNFKAGYLHRDMTTRSRPNPSRTGSTNCRNPSPCPGMRACRPRQLHSHRGRLAHSRPQRLPLESFEFWILSGKPTVSRWWKKPQRPANVSAAFGFAAGRRSTATRPSLPLPPVLPRT